MKMRIMSRSRALAIMHEDMFGSDFERLNSDDRRLAHFSMTAYMLADGKTVKIYEDRDMGGTVVEYDD